MKITAKQFAKSPLEAYRRADRGEEVIIEHARYPDIEFRLFAKSKKGNSLVPPAYAESEVGRALTKAVADDLGLSKHPCNLRADNPLTTIEEA